MTNTLMSIRNPYQHGSKMRRVFNLLIDGEFHRLSEVVPLVLGSLAVPQLATNQRTASSFVRTLREKFTVIHDRNLGYKLTNVKGY